ncbi:MAG: type II toxin-antitoxin system HicA family toxin, partial [Candidatus Dadabacteria bacterium]
SEGLVPKSSGLSLDGNLDLAGRLAPAFPDASTTGNDTKGHRLTVKECVGVIKMLRDRLDHQKQIELAYPYVDQDGKRYKFDDKGKREYYTEPEAIYAGVPPELLDVSIEGAEALSLLSGKHLRTLRGILSKSRNLRWSSVRSVLEALGATIDESRSGSRVAIHLGEDVKVLHKPHGSKPLIIGAVQDLARWLEHKGFHL